MLRGAAALAGTFALLLAAAAAPAAAAPANGASGCRPAGSKTIVASRHARVFRHRRLVYGCLYSRGVRVPLTERDDFSETALGRLRPRLAGRFVGYAYVWQNAVTGGDGIAVTDLRRGRTRAIELDPGFDGHPFVEIADLVATRGGSVAWTWTADYSGDADDPGVREVRKLEPGDSTRRFGVRLDSGPEIDLTSLEVRGATVSWLKGGERSSATLR